MTKQLEWLKQGERPEYSPFSKQLTWEEIELLAEKLYPEWDSEILLEYDVPDEHDKELRKLCNIVDFRIRKIGD